MQYANLQLNLALDVQKETYQAQYSSKNLVVVHVTPIHAYKTISSQNCLLSFWFLESDMASIDSTRCVWRYYKHNEVPLFWWTFWQSCDPKLQEWMYHLSGTNLFIVENAPANTHSKLRKFTLKKCKDSLAIYMHLLFIACLALSCFIMRAWEFLHHISSSIIIRDSRWKYAIGKIVNRTLSCHFLKICPLKWYHVGWKSPRNTMQYLKVSCIWQDFQVKERCNLWFRWL